MAPLFERFASRAWRRPATVPEVARLVALFDAAIAAGDDFTAATRQCVVAVLSSPKFLFRLEVDAKPDDAKAAHALDDFELASRLSYFLWSSLPDDRLEEAARRRRLAEPATLVAETRRMLADPRADTLVTQFAAQWLDLNGIDDVEPDRALFHHFDLGLRLAMRQETELFVRAVFFESRPLATLVDADFTFVNDRLARFYGIADVKGSAMRRVALSPGRRGGVLTQASLLTLTSTPSRTSPTKRGRLVLERFLGTPPKPPPPGVGALDESSADVRGLPIAQRLARHRRDPTCAACHAAIDPLGLALEDFDPIGRARAHVEVDASLRQLPDGTTLDGAASLKALVLRRDLFTRCFARKLDTFALGRGLGEDDLRAVDAAVDSFGGRSPTLEELVVALVQLDSFRRRRGEAPDVAVGGR